MTLRRWAAAALVLLSVAYLRFTMPVFAERVMPALRDVLCCEQIRFVMPDEAAAWTVSN